MINEMMHCRFIAARFVATSCVLVVFTTGCASGVRLYDEPKARSMSEIKTQYAQADVLGLIEVERQNLSKLLAEEIRTIRENSQLQVDFALLSLVDDNAPMADTYLDEGLSRIEALGFLNGQKELRQFLMSDAGRAIRSPELDLRADRIAELTGQLPPRCHAASQLSNSMTWPSDISEFEQGLANIQYVAYVSACKKLQQELSSAPAFGGKLKQALDDWQAAQTQLLSRRTDIEDKTREYRASKAAHRKAVKAREDAIKSGDARTQQLRSEAERTLDTLKRAKKALDALGSGALEGDTVADIVTLLTATAGGDIDTDDPDIRIAAVILRELPSLAGEMTLLIERAQAPTVSNLLIEMNHQLLRKQYAEQLAALSEERVAILKAKFVAYKSEARRWLDFTDAMCNFATASHKKDSLGEACDDFLIIDGGNKCILPVPASAEIANCQLGKPWHKNIQNPPNDAATRELYKALAAYVRALSSQSTQKEQSFRLVDVKHRETLVAKENAVRSWNNLVVTPIGELDAYFQSGIKATEIADLLVKALGLTAIAIGVSN